MNASAKLLALQILTFVFLELQSVDAFAASGSINPFESVGPVVLGMTSQQVLQALPAAVRVSESPLVLATPGMVISFARGTNGTVTSITVTDGSFKTGQGVGVGSVKDAVEKEFGRGYEAQQLPPPGIGTVLSYFGGGIKFLIAQNDHVQSVSVCRSGSDCAPSTATASSTEAKASTRDGQVAQAAGMFNVCNITQWTARIAIAWSSAAEKSASAGWWILKTGECVHVFPQDSLSGSRYLYATAIDSSGNSREVDNNGQRGKPFCVTPSENFVLHEADQARCAKKQIAEFLAYPDQDIRLNFRLRSPLKQ